MLYPKKTCGLFEEGLEDGTFESDPTDGIDLSAVEDNLDGNEANAEEIEQAQDAEFDFDGTADHVTECYQIVYETECAWNEIMSTLGEYALSEAAEGRAVVLEANDIKGFFQRAIEMINAMVHKVASMVKSAIVKLVASKSRVDKYFKANQKKITDGAKKATDIMGYNFKDWGKQKGFMINALKDASASCEMLDPTSEKQALAYLKKDKNDVDSMIGEYRASLLGGKGKDYTDQTKFRQKLVEKFRGDYVKVVMSEQKVKTLQSDINNTAGDIEDVKKAFKSFEVDANLMIKKLQNAMKAMEKDERKDLKPAYTKAISVYKRMKSDASVALSAFITVCFDRIKQNFKVARKCAAAGSKKEKKEDKRGTKVESAGLFGSTEENFISLLDS